jgi:hypothetical protein
VVEVPETSKVLIVEMMVMIMLMILTVKELIFGRED